MLGYLDTLIGFAVVMLGVSLIVTILTQIASSLFSHRGATLLWGLQVLFRQMNPKANPVIAAKARDLAEIVLTHPLASDSLLASANSEISGTGLWSRLVRRWRLANAISASDLVAVLKNIATNPPGNMHTGTAAILGAEINSMLAQPSPLALRQATMAQAVAPAMPAALVPGAIGVTETQSGNLEVLFNKMLDRVSQRFTMCMRIWTVAFSFVIATVGCIDTFDLARKLLSDAGLRAQLVNAAPQMIQIADRNRPGLETKALAQAVKEAGVPGTPSEIWSAQAGYQWIDDNVKDPAKNKDLKAKFDADAKTEAEAEAHDAQTIATTLTSAGVLKFDSSGWTTAKRNGNLLLTLLGVLVSGLLLSLGGPFWYNTLKSLVSLRPLLAGKQEDAQKTTQ